MKESFNLSTNKLRITRMIVEIEEEWPRQTTSASRLGRYGQRARRKAVDSVRNPTIARFNQFPDIADHSCFISPVYINSFKHIH